MKTLTTFFIRYLQVHIVLICLVCMPGIVYAIEPIGTIGQPLPEKHAFLSNDQILRVVPTHIQLVDPNTSEVVDEFGERTYFSDVVFSPTATHLAILNHTVDPKTTTVNIWDVNRQELLTKWVIASRVDDNDAAFSPTQPIFATYLAREIHLWNWQTGKSIGKMARVNFPPYKAMAFSPDSRYLIVASAHYIEVWNVEKLLFEGHFDGPVLKRIENMAISPNGKVIATSEHDSPLIYVWDMETWQLLWRQTSGIGRVSSMQFSPDSQHLYVATATSGLRRSGHGPWQGWDDQVYVWDINSGQQIDTFGTEFRYLNMMALSPDGKTALLHYRDAEVLWDTREKQQRNVWADYPSWKVGLSSDGKTFISVSHTHFKTWDIPSQKLNLLVSSEDEMFENFAFSPDGKNWQLAETLGLNYETSKQVKLKYSFPISLVWLRQLPLVLLGGCLQLGMT